MYRGLRKLLRFSVAIGVIIVVIAYFQLYSGRSPVTKSLTEATEDNKELTQTEGDEITDEREQRRLRNKHSRKQQKEQTDEATEEDSSFENQPQGEKTQKLPTAIIMGVKKCGTGALGSMLGRHPDLVFTIQAQGHFFDDIALYKKGLEAYRQLMQPSYEHQITIDKSPRYFIDEETPERIKKMNSSILLILTVKDPIQRFISDYLHVTRVKTMTASLEDVIQLPVHTKLREHLLSPSKYHHHFSRWLRSFNLNQIHIVDGNTLIDNPVEELQKIETFLGVKQFFKPKHFVYNSEKGFYCNADIQGKEKCLKKGHVQPNITRNSRDILHSLLSDEVYLFKQDIARTLSWMKDY